MPSNITLYSLYKDSGFTPALFLASLLYLIITIPGLAMNFTIFYITLKKKNASIFKTKTHYLIAFMSFFEFCHQSGHILFFMVVSSGHNFIPARIAFPILFIPVVGVQCGLILVNFTGIDRLLAVLFPISYRNWPTRGYVAVMLFFCVSISLAINIHLGYLNFAGDPERPVTGFIGEIAAVPGYEWSANLAIFINGSTIVLYAFIVIIVKCKKMQNEAAIGRLYKSVILIVLLNVGVYFLSSVFAFQIFFKINLESQVDGWFFNIANGLVYNLSIESNFPILYINCKDYREAIREEWKWISKLGNNNAVAPASAVQRSLPSVGRILARIDA